jgi:hypothetical protein
LVDEYSIRKSFTDLCLLLKASGCIAVSGGLEVASDRLLKLIDKGVTVEQVARSDSQFYRSRSYGTCVSYVWLSTQTIQETVDSLEGSSIVRSRSFVIRVSGINLPWQRTVLLECIQRNLV